MTDKPEQACYLKIKWLETEIRLLMDLNDKIHIDTVLEKFINEVLTVLKEKTNFEGANIALVDAEKGALRSYPLSPELYNDRERYDRVKIFFNQEYPLFSNIWICTVATEKKEIFYPEISETSLEDFSTQEKLTLQRLGYSGCFFLPLLLGDKSLGTLVLYNIKEPMHLKEREKDSIRRLASMIARAVENTRIYNAIRSQKEVIEKQNLELARKNEMIENKNRVLMDELELARKIQENLIPWKMPVLKNARFSSLYKPLEAVGGDFFDFIRVREPNLLGIFVSDVSGHGVPAALITSMVKTLAETAGPARLSPGDFLKFINDKILGQTSGNFLTAFYGVYNQETRTLTYSRASHNYPFLIRGDSLIPLESRGKMLGVMEGLEFEEKEIELQPGDKVLFYTDGLVEAENPAGKEFEDIISELLISYRSLPIEEYLETIYHDLLEFREDYRFDDDICMIGMEIL
jgi:serine phosphatase RsbU (regulator of sigma subunit)